MNKTKAVLLDGYCRALLSLVHSTNQPELAIGLLDLIPRIQTYKIDLFPRKSTFIQTYTKSTRQLVQRALVLYEQPEHAASNNYPDLARRRVFDWDLTGFGRNDIEPLKRVLTGDKPPRHIRSAERREQWQDARQALIIDILTLCDINVNHKAVG